MNPLAPVTNTLVFFIEENSWATTAVRISEKVRWCRKLAENLALRRGLSTYTETHTPHLDNRICAYQTASVTVTRNEIETPLQSLRAPI